MNLRPASRQDILASLVNRTAKGDWAAFTTLYTMTSPQVYGVMLHMTNFAQSCEDLLQEVYIAVWRRASSYEPEKAQVGTWLTAIARNRTLDWLRSQQAGMDGRIADGDPEAMELAAGTDDPEALAATATSRTALVACLNELGAQQRQAIFLAYVKGHTHAELARHLNTALGTVKSWVRRGLQQLRSCLQDSGASP
jgi:RNA polymerase sigma-70 factor (ECF subfamily)